MEHPVQVTDHLLQLQIYTSHLVFHLIALIL